MFQYVLTSGNTYKFQCLLCMLKYTEYSTYRNSPSNLKKHVDRVHPSQIDAYDNLAACARKRKLDNTGIGGAAKKLKQQRITSPASAAAERLFSCARLTMNSRRTSMTDSLFENLVLLKKNKCLL